MLATLPVPLIVSVAGFSHDEFATLVQAVADRGEVAALELNVSCPNVKSGCVVGSEAGEMASLMRRVRPLTAKPLIVKLTPNVSDVGAGRARRAGGRRRRALVDQHAARGGRRPGLRPTVAGRRAAAVSPVPAVRAVALAHDRRGRGRDRAAAGRHGRYPGRPATRSTSSPRGRRASQSGPRPFATRWPARACATSWHTSCSVARCVRCTMRVQRRALRAARS